MGKPYARLRHAAYTHKPNALKIPITKLHYTSDNVALFNSIYFYIKSRKDFNKIERTASGGISNRCPLSLRHKRWDLRSSDSWIELTIIENAGMWRIQVSPNKEKDTPILSGRQAYFMFREFIKKFNIDLESYAVKNGAIINTKIEKPLIALSHEPLRKNRVFHGVNHIDFHNSYPAGLANTHPEFREGIEYLYNNRKRKPEYKDLLNFTIGFFHSKYCQYKYAQLAKDAIEDSNRRVLELAERVERANRVVLLYNTDGFWYLGKPYHGEGEGAGLGQWHNDHIDCKFRAKSAGAYEYVENEEYHPVIRGHTNLDEIKDRDSWEWGDIYQEEAVIKKYAFSEEKGIYEV